MKGKNDFFNNNIDDAVARVARAAARAVVDAAAAYILFVFMPLVFIFFIIILANIETSSKNYKLGPSISSSHNYSTQRYRYYYFKIDTLKYKKKCGNVIQHYGNVLKFKKGCELQPRLRTNKLIAKPTPKPTPRPTSTPVPYVYPTPIPTAVPLNSCNGNCTTALLTLINQERASHGYAPLQLNVNMSNGIGSCIGAMGHSIHMAQTGQLAHDQFPADVCGSYTTAGENIGEGSGDEWWTISQTFQAMISEPGYYPGCNNSHKCNILSESFNSIGIGIAQGQGNWFITEDFKG